MKNRKHVILIAMVLITIFCAWNYIQRAHLEYNTQGSYFSTEDAVVYYEQTKEIYGILSILGCILVGILLFKRIKK